MDRIWTAALVEEILTDAFRKNPFTGIYSPTKRSFAPAVGQRIEPIELIGLVTRILRDPEVRRYRDCQRPLTDDIALLTWARAQVNREHSVNEACHQKHWNRRAFDDAKDRGAQKVADWINRARMLDAA